ncbi:hypothetical protein BDN72DRAFT_759620 [Pluteus cervinus]|uniref:Uncharacterized protein n=1 Tax=Pluteus cervinus TaxID=181527 RepID=A0ACD3B9T8_9AGAR|nr:hypothetical protein BDN72DRAFT_759620 [Pluteus cervinus]
MLRLSTARHLRPHILCSRPSSYSRLFSWTTIARNQTDQIPRKPKFDELSSYTETEESRPTWELGDGAVRFSSDVGVDGEKTVWDMAEVPTRETYQFLTSGIVPRPIALVSSLSADGVPNLAPFRYFALKVLKVAHNPPIISLSFSIPSKRPKDTRENILATKEFTVNIVTESLVQAINATSAEAPAHVDEWVLSGLSQGPSKSVRPPVVLESPVNLECELYSSQDIHHPKTGELTTTLVLGRIKQLHVRNSVLSEDGHSIDPAKLRPISRLGGTKYGRLLEGFSLPRVSWKASKEAYEALLGKKQG